MGTSRRSEKKGFAEALLAWYDREARVLPWRQGPGEPPADPYHVLVSEIMLQQTTVATVLGRYEPFLELFPTLYDLAAAPEADVLAAWAGLGYYRRARALHACARALAADHGGVFPRTATELKALPGIGDYTGAAIAAIAFGEAVTVVDGNVERVVARVFDIDQPLPGARKVLRARAEDISPDQRPGDYAQAMMDLGATVCRPRSPQCMLCCVRPFCDGVLSGDPERLPVKAAKKSKKVVTGKVLVLRNEQGEVYCQDRPAKGLLAGMLGLPGGGWDGAEVPAVSAELVEAGSISHTLTHRQLEIDVLTAVVSSTELKGRWLPVEHAREAMPTLFRKALERGLNSDPYE